MSRRSRSQARESGAQALRGLGFRFESRNGGSHLIVEDRFDFWPGTRVWIERRGPMRGTGLDSLVATLQGRDAPGPSPVDTMRDVLRDCREHLRASGGPESLLARINEFLDP